MDGNTDQLFASNVINKASSSTYQLDVDVDTCVTRHQKSRVTVFFFQRGRLPFYLEGE